MLAPPRRRFGRVNARVTAATHGAASLVVVSPSAEAEYVLRAVEERGIRFVRLWFTDVLGFLKSFTITSQELEGAFAEGMGFDGSSIEGFSRIQESDMVAHPDPSTFQLIPWRAESQVARMFCDIQNPDGSAFDGDPRGVLKRQLQRAADLGFTFYVGPELEYFYFRSVDDPSFLDQGGYFDETPLDVATDWRKRTVAYLEAMGIPVEYVHHEVAPSQHEIDLRYTDALTMADNVMTYRLTVKEVAQEFGIYATFMPKPVMGVNGSGMHTHQSLFSGDRNAFFQEGDEYHLSKVGKHYIAGLLAHAPELTLLTNQWVNSYKRLVPGFEAPVYVCWARRNRSALVRVPMYKPGKEGATRVEFRSPDPACNPYLAFASMLAAGLEGVENEYELPPEASNNIYEMTAEERVAAGIRSLPEDLNEAIHAAQDSKVLRECLGEHVHEFLIRNKREEWDAYKAYVTPYELERYFPIL
jgi:glutamine synthetase